MSVLVCIFIVKSKDDDDDETRKGMDSELSFHFRTEIELYCIMDVSRRRHKVTVGSDTEYEGIPNDFVLVVTAGVVVVVSVGSGTSVVVVVIVVVVVDVLVASKYFAVPSL